jgi:hypothetical protein
VNVYGHLVRAFAIENDVFTFAILLLNYFKTLNFNILQYEITRQNKGQMRCAMNINHIMIVSKTLQAKRGKDDQSHCQYIFCFGLFVAGSSKSN